MAAGGAPAARRSGGTHADSLTFTALVRIRGVNPYVVVDSTRVTAIRPNWRRPLPVLVRINGTPPEPWRTNMMPVGDGSFFLYLHGPARKASRTRAGDRVRLEIRFDAEYRNGPLHPMPDWFESALSKHPRARRNWSALSPSRRKEVLRYFAQLKSRDARTRNLRRALEVLSGGPGRFMGRDWVDGA
jgi:bacteriocin resistance YdeI/OmpD-like protein/uncharacterized protein DUF1905